MTKALQKSDLKSLDHSQKSIHTWGKCRLMLVLPSKFAAHRENFEPGP